LADQPIKPLLNIIQNTRIWYEILCQSVDLFVG